MMRLTGTSRYVNRMALFLVGVVALAGVLFPVLRVAFLHNPGLNGAIIVILLIGCAYVFRQVLMLAPEIVWLSSFGTDKAAVAASPVKLLGPMATMLGDRKGKLSLSPASANALLDTIGSRLDESRDISRYMIGLLILLGLLGTFWGLIQTVGSVADVVGRLSMEGGDPVAAFDELKRGLATPLAAMGTAFSSSLFGLAGSLVLGFLDLQAGQAQNRFFNELEEWLATQTKLATGGPMADGDHSAPAYIQALLEKTADSLDKLQRTMALGEESRIATNANLVALTERLSAPVGDEVQRGHLRKIELAVTRLAEETAQARADVLQEIRAEIRLLARTIAAVKEDTEAR
jgi:hypothetical protein